MEAEWDHVMTEKNITLFQNNNSYKMSFDVNNQDKSIYSDINEIVKTNQLFDLLFELNKDFIDNINTTNNDSGSQYSIIKIINTKQEYYNHKTFNIHINCLYQEKDESNCSIISKSFENNISLENDIYLSNFDIIMSKKESGVGFLIYFSFDKEIFDSDLIKMCVSMYILKIFYRLKLYFE